MPSRRPSTPPHSRGDAIDAARPYAADTATRQREPGGIAHETGELHRLLVETVQDYAIFALDPHGCILSWNAGAERFKGYTADEILGKHFSIFYPAEKVAERFPDFELREAARTGRFEDEGWRIRKDGSRFWANVVITALRDRTGALVGYAKVTRDLTERRAAEERAIQNAQRVATEEAARREAEDARRRAERLQALTASLSAARTSYEVIEVLLHDALPVLGMDASDVALSTIEADDVTVVVHSSHATPSPSRATTVDRATPIGAALLQGDIVVCRSRADRDARFPSLGPTYAPFEVTVALPLTIGSRRLGALVLYRREAALSRDDMWVLQSFAQQSAQAIDRARLYDAAEVARREAEESRTQAEEARRRADEANRAKSEFLAAMSHELRTPLNAIAGYTELLELEIGGPVTEEQRAQLQRIRRSQRHLLGIINDLLNFSRIEAGQVEYVYAALDVADVMESVSHMIIPQAESGGIAFVVKPCSPNTTVWADRAKTEQILLNLLSNAVKFTGRGGKVTLRCDHADPRSVRLTVRDTGIGIPADQQSRIFEPFVQVGRSLTSVREGTGLGLAISRDLARAMGGDIVVQSTPDVGSAFTLCLPTSPRAAAATKSDA
jgi:PAS domain S-box-containing protein